MSKKSRNVKIYTDSYKFKTKALLWLENNVTDIHERRQVTSYLEKWIDLLVKCQEHPDYGHAHDSFRLIYSFRSQKMWQCLPFHIATAIDNHINACRRLVFLGYQKKTKNG